MTVLCRRSGTQLTPELDARYIRDTNWHALALRDDEIREILHIAGLARDAHEPLGAVVLDEARAPILVVHAQCGKNVVVRQAEGQQPCRIDGDEYFFLEAADRIDLDDARHAQKLRADDPVVNGPQIHRCDGGAVGIRRAGLGIDREHEDLAKAGRNRTQSRLHVLRQGGAGRAQALGDLLAREVDVGSVLEDDRDLRQAVTGYRSRVVEARQARHRILERKRDPLLDLERRIARSRRIDDDLNVGDIGNGVDRQAREVPDAEARHEQDEHEHESAPSDAELQEMS